MQEVTKNEGSKEKSGHGKTWWTVHHVFPSFLSFGLTGNKWTDQYKIHCMASLFCVHGLEEVTNFTTMSLSLAIAGTRITLQLEVERGCWMNRVPRKSKKEVVINTYSHLDWNLFLYHVHGTNISFDTWLRSCHSIFLKLIHSYNSLIIIAIHWKFHTGHWTNKIVDYNKLPLDIDIIVVKKLSKRWWDADMVSQSAEWTKHLLMEQIYLKIKRTLHCSFDALQKSDKRGGNVHGKRENKMGGSLCADQKFYSKVDWFKNGSTPPT